MLSATNIAGNPNSHFHFPSLTSWQNEHGLTPDTTQSPQDAMRAVLTKTLQHGRGNTDLFALRLMRKSFDYLTAQLAILYPDLPTDAARFDAAFGRTLYIHLTREDKIAQAVSLVKATQTGLWHRAPDGRELERLSPPQPLKYDFAEIDHNVQELKAFDHDWTRWFGDQNITPHHISYEALSRNPTQILASLLQRLGLDETCAKTVSPEVRKLADTTNIDWIERYKDDQTVYRDNV